MIEIHIFIKHIDMSIWCLLQLVYIMLLTEIKFCRLSQQDYMIVCHRTHVKISKLLVCEFHVEDDNIMDKWTMHRKSR